MKDLTIQLWADKVDMNLLLSLRHTLTDTLEKRGIGRICTEGVGRGYVEVVLEDVSPRAENEILSVLSALGIKDRARLIRSKD
jgi:hypothetical protein